MNAINLVPTPRIAAAQRRRRSRLWVAVGAVYATALLSVVSGAAVAWNTDVETPGSHLSALLEENERRRTESKAVTADIQEKLRELAANRAVGSQPDWSILLNLLGRVVGNDAALRNVRLEAEAPPQPAPQPPTAGASADAHKQAPPADALQPRAFTLRLSGLARSQSSVSRVVAQLEASGLFDSIEWRETRREGDGDLVSFLLHCRISAGGAAASPAKEGGRK